MIIDKDLFPNEYSAIKGLLDRSEQIEKERKERTKEKLKRIEECRRALDEEHTG